MKMLPKFIAVVLVLTAGGAGVLSGCATQGDMYTLDDRLASLERRNETAAREREELRSSLGHIDESRETDKQGLRGQVATLRVDMDALREEVQRLNGQVEEALYLIKQKIALLEDLDRKKQQQIKEVNESVEANQAVIQRIESYLNLEKTAPPATADPSPAAAVVQPATEKQLAEDQLYLSAKKALENGEFEIARKGFAELIDKHPQSGHADNAQFWIGESYYKEKWYEKAILEYQKVIEKYPKGNKVQASLLKQGFAFLNLGDSANARLILKELIRKYPKSNESAIARKKIEGLK